MTSIDELDVEIIERLSKDARTGVAELATMLGVSRNTIQQRMRRLEESGLIAGYLPRIDLSAAGLPVQALIALETDQHQLARIIDALAGIPNVLEARTQAGHQDLLLLIGAENLESLQDLTARIVRIPGVRRTETTLTVSTPIPYRLGPVLASVAKGRGWGRSTPAPG